MKAMFLAAAAVLSMGVGCAYANENGAQAGGYVYPEYIFPGSVYAGAQTPAPAVPARDGQAIHAYVTHSNRGTWLFAPNENQGGNS